MKVEESRIEFIGSTAIQADLSISEQLEREVHLAQSLQQAPASAISRFRDEVVHAQCDEGCYGEHQS
ncbi:MAG: hypothetical protein JOZ29_09315 [Deltaproteobacteria bacterium]|nr:hypothetical protein [Deltaproteobacteria bacterium]